MRRAQDWVSLWILRCPSPIIAKLLQHLPWMCQNYKTGCREISMNVEELEHHHGKCIYRLVFCPDIQCQSVCKVLFKDVFDHLKAFHKLNEYQMVIGKPLVTKKKTGGNKVENGSYWYPGNITSSCGSSFFAIAKVDNNTIYSCIVLMGSTDQARNYSYTCAVTSNIGEKFVFSGPVPTVDRSVDDIIASGSLLTIGNDVFNRSLNEDKQFEVEITVRNLKEEAKDDDMESGVSDGELVEIN